MGVVWHPWGFGFKQSSFHPIARVLQGLWLQRFGRALLYEHALVPVVFRREVSR